MALPLIAGAPTRHVVVLVADAGAVPLRVPSGLPWAIWMTAHLSALSSMDELHPTAVVVSHDALQRSRADVDAYLRHRAAGRTPPILVLVTDRPHVIAAMDRQRFDRTCAPAQISMVLDSPSYVRDALGGRWLSEPPS